MSAQLPRKYRKELVDLLDRIENQLELNPEETDVEDLIRELRRHREVLEQEHLSDDQIQQLLLWLNVFGTFIRILLGL